MTPILDKFGEKKHVSVTGRLYILLIVMVLPFIAFSLYKAFDIRSSLEDKYQQEGLRLVKSMSSSIDENISSTGELLISVANNENVRTQNYAKVNDYLEQIVIHYPFYSNIILVDNAGTIEAAGRNANKDTSKINVQDTAYYKRAIQSNGIAIGDFMYGKLSGKPVVHVTYPVFDYSGNRIGFVAAAFDLSKVQNKLLEPSIPSYVEIGVIDNKGTILARNKETKKFVGRNISKEVVFTSMQGRDEGFDKLKAPDGATRLFAFTKTARVPWYVRAGVNEKYILAQVRQELIHHFEVFIPLLLIAIFGWLWIGKDVSMLHKKTEYLSLSDPLTGLFNYRKLERDTQQELSRSRRYKERLSFAMIDIDHFKFFNDTNGHQLGDEALFQVAREITNMVRASDSVYRYGGEEFCVLMPHTTRDGALLLAERIREAIEALTIKGARTQPQGSLTVSIGVATYPLDAISKEGLIKSADIALYRAKKKGRNRVEGCLGDDFNAMDGESIL